MKLGKDVFSALAAVIWADGVVTDAEASALVDAARASGLSGKDLDEIAASTKTKVTFDALKKLKLADDERTFVYSIAAWLTRADGKVTVEETDMLADLGDRLGLSDDDRAVAIAASYSLDAFGDSGGRDPSALAKEIARSANERG